MDTSKIRYSDVEWSVSDGQRWRIGVDTEIDWWLGKDEDKPDWSLWDFRHAETKEPISRDDFLEICRREVELERNQQPVNDDMLDSLRYTKESLEEHPTGALRESKAGKGRPDLFLAGFPRAVMAVCRHMDCELGRQRNWEKGLPESSLISSQFRHLLGYASGVSEDTPEYNLRANAWNALVLLEEYLRIQDGVMDPHVLDVDKPAEPIRVEKPNVQD